VGVLVTRELVEVAPGVHVARSRRDSTTSTVIQAADGAVVLVDPAWEPDELAGLAATVSGRGWRAAAGFATHAHHDHLLWHPDLGDVPRYASATTARLAHEHRAELVAALGAAWPAELAALVGVVSPGGDELAVGGLSVEVVEHDAHAPGHAALWLPDRRVLLAGDMLSDLELPLPFDPDDLAGYLAGLEALAPYVAGAAVVVPGHGRPTDRPAERLDADRRYLDALLAGVDAPDPRRGHPGMAQVHERLRRLAAGG
jgi:glyoxylase-like metal-dependent hydrolase (beta-lactamase superfamily II)